MKRTWTPEMITTLKVLYPDRNYSIKEIATVIGKTIPSIKSKAGVLKLSRSYHVVWTPEMIELLKKEYPFTEVKLIAEKLGIGKSPIYRKANELDLKKDISFLRIMAENLAKRGQAHRFPKGHIPMNKGKKQTEYMSEEAISKTKKTRFKKGHKPHNTLHNGAIRPRTDKRTGITYMYIRLDEGNWKEYHRYIWEQSYGPIPKGSNIVFKDGNSKNCDISNLILLTDAQLMAQNTIQKYPEELRNYIIKLGKFKSKLKKIQDGKNTL